MGLRDQYGMELGDPVPEEARVPGESASWVSLVYTGGEIMGMLLTCLDSLKHGDDWSRRFIVGMLDNLRRGRLTKLTPKQMNMLVSIYMSHEINKTLGRNEELKRLFEENVPILESAVAPEAPRKPAAAPSRGPIMGAGKRGTPEALF